MTSSPCASPALSRISHSSHVLFQASNAERAQLDALKKGATAASGTPVKPVQAQPPTDIVVVPSSATKGRARSSKAGTHSTVRARGVEGWVRVVFVRRRVCFVALVASPLSLLRDTSILQELSWCISWQIVLNKLHHSPHLNDKYGVLPVLVAC